MSIPYSLKFDGVNDYVLIGDPAGGELDFGTNPFSFGCWVRVEQSASLFDNAWAKGWYLGADARYLLSLGTGPWRGSIADGSVEKIGELGVEELHKWTHLILVIDRAANLLRPYKNGATLSPVDIAGFGSVSNTSNATIGGIFATLWFKGRVDDMRVYNKALSAAEVLTLYGGTDPDPTALAGCWKLDDGTGLIATDSSANANHGTLTGGPLWSRQVPLALTAVADRFPLPPWWPVGRGALDRKARFEVESGEIWVRNLGATLRKFSLRSRCSSTDAQTLRQFYEDHAVDGCYLPDPSLGPNECWAVKFLSPPTFEETMYELWNWEVELQELP